MSLRVYGKTTVHVGKTLRTPQISERAEDAGGKRNIADLCPTKLSAMVQDIRADHPEGCTFKFLMALHRLASS